MQANFEMLIVLFRFLIGNRWPSNDYGFRRAWTTEDSQRRGQGPLQLVQGGTQARAGMLLGGFQGWCVEDVKGRDGTIILASLSCYLLSLGFPGGRSALWGSPPRLPGQRPEWRGPLGRIISFC